jgi:hypothetical protein
MTSEAQTGSKLPRAKLLAALDQAYDRIAIGDNDTANIETLRNLFGEICSLLKDAGLNVDELRLFFRE